MCDPYFYKTIYTKKSWVTVKGHLAGKTLQADVKGHAPGGRQGQTLRVTSSAGFTGHALGGR